MGRNGGCDQSAVAVDEGVWGYAVCHRTDKEQRAGDPRRTGARGEGGIDAKYDVFGIIVLNFYAAVCEQFRSAVSSDRDAAAHTEYAEGSDDFGRQNADEQGQQRSNEEVREDEEENG